MEEPAMPAPCGATAAAEAVSAAPAEDERGRRPEGPGAEANSPETGAAGVAAAREASPPDEGGKSEGDSAEEESEEEEELSGGLGGVKHGDHDYSIRTIPPGVEVFRGMWDDEGVYVYQAYKDEIADWAVEHQRFGGPSFGVVRMTWVKPSFAWVLYRSGYGRKHNQSRVLRVKLPHAAMAELLCKCKCKDGGGGSKGRVQWDPARDLLSGDGREPRKLLRGRAIQIGLKASLSELYVRSVLSIEDVTELAHSVGEAHRAKSKAAMDAVMPDLPEERPYMPRCTDDVLQRLQMLPGGAVQGGRGGRGHNRRR